MYLIQISLTRSWEEMFRGKLLEEMFATRCCKTGFLHVYIVMVQVTD